MKQNLLLLLFAFSTTFSFCQTSIEGFFSNERDTLVFKNDTISLSISSNGGFISPLKGVGEYTISNNKLIIKTGENSDKAINEKMPKAFGDTQYLEDKIVVFQIEEQSKSRLELVLIGVCDKPAFKGRKTIRQFERDHKRLTYRQRTLMARKQS